MATATIKDVAKKAGVGVGTVSRVLNGSTAVSDATRDKVLSVIDALDYIPNANARRLSLGRTMTIAVIVPFFTRPSVVERLRGIEKVLAASEYDLILYNVETAHRRRDCFQNVSRRERVDGMIIISLMPTDAEAERLKQTDVPIVLVDTHHAQFNSIMIDDVDGAYRATSHLIDLGHTKIAHIGDFMDNPFNFRQIHDRYQGYRQALQEANISFRSDYHLEGEHSQREAQQLAYELLTSDDPPTAIFAFSDTQAIGIMKAARDLGLHVPEQLSVIGYDDIEIAEYLHLTTIRQSLLQSGLEGGQLLLETMATSAAKPQERLLPTELIVRGTTAPPQTA